MTEPRRFDSIDHLSAEAVAAFVDGELTPTARMRALNHLVHCPECADDVAAQRLAATRLFTAAQACPHASGDLFAKLASIPTTCPTDGPDASLSVCRPAASLSDLLDTLYRRGMRALGHPVSPRSALPADAPTAPTRYTDKP